MHHGLCSREVPARAPDRVVVVFACGKWLLDAFNGYKQRRALEDLGRVKAERDQAETARQATQRELEASHNAPRTVDDAIARLEDEDRPA